MTEDERARLREEAATVRPATDFLFELVDYASDLTEIDADTNTAYKLAGVLFQRVLEQAAAARILVKEGWLRQSEAILRPALEYSLYISLLAKYPEHAGGLIGLETIQERKLLKKVSQMGFDQFPDGESLDEKLRKNGMRRRGVRGPVEALRTQLNAEIERQEQRLSHSQNRPVTLPRIMDGELPEPWHIAITVEIDKFDRWWHLLCESSHFNLLQVQRDHLRMLEEGGLVRVTGRDFLNAPSAVSDWAEVLLRAMNGINLLGEGYLDTQIEHWKVRWAEQVRPLLAAVVQNRQENDSSSRARP